MGPRNRPWVDDRRWLSAAYEALQAGGLLAIAGSRPVANLTRSDGDAFLSLAPRVPVRTEIVVFPLAAANEALARLREGRLSGAAVLQPFPDQE